MKKTQHKILAMLLAVMLIAGVLPMTASAAPAPTVTLSNGKVLNTNSYTYVGENAIPVRALEVSFRANGGGAVHIVVASGQLSQDALMAGIADGSLPCYKDPDPFGAGGVVKLLITDADLGGGALSSATDVYVVMIENGVAKSNTLHLPIPAFTPNPASDPNVDMAPYFQDTDWDFNISDTTARFGGIVAVLPNSPFMNADVIKLVSKGKEYTGDFSRADGGLWTMDYTTMMNIATDNNATAVGDTFTFEAVFGIGGVEIDNMFSRHTITVTVVSIAVPDPVVDPDPTPAPSNMPFFADSGWNFNLDADSDMKFGSQMTYGTGDYADAEVIHLVSNGKTYTTGFSMDNPPSFGIQSSTLLAMAEDNGAVAGDSFTIEVVFGINGVVLTNPGGRQNITINVARGGYWVNFYTNYGVNDTHMSGYTDVNGYIIVPSSPSRPGYIFTGWYTAAIGGARVTGEVQVSAATNYYAHWITDAPVGTPTDPVRPPVPVRPPTPSNPGNGNNNSNNNNNNNNYYNGNDDDDDYGNGSDNNGGGGGGSRSGGSSSSASSAGAQAPVTAANATAAVTAALASATENGAVANLRNPGGVSLDTLKAMATQAGDTPLRVNADSVVGNAVDVRISFNPALATADLDLSASTVNQAAENRKEQFEKFFSNDLMAIALGQQGSFGMPVQIAAMLDPALDPENLVFYTYDSATGSYSQIADPAYWVDANGYVHFTTSVGGGVVISDGALAHR